MLIFPIFFVIAIVFSVIRGLTLDVFWNWFVTGPNAPFQGVPDISFVQALGLSLLITFLTFQPGAEKEDESGPAEAIVKVIATGVIFYTFIWVSAIIYHALAS